MTLTEEQIAEIRARVEAATPESWILDGIPVTRPDLHFIKHARDDIHALLSALEAANKRADEAERTSRNRDMWKGQCERQSAELTALRARVEELEGRAVFLLSEIDAHQDYDSIVEATSDLRTAIKGTCL